MAKYHINPKTGNVGVCQANVRNCFFLLAPDEHFDSEEEARKYYEESMEVIPPKKLTKEKRVAKDTKVSLQDALNAKVFTENLDPSPAVLSESGNYLNAAVIKLNKDGTINPWSSISVDKAVEIKIGLPKSEWPSELREIVTANENKWSNIDAWDVELEPSQESGGPSPLSITASSSFDEKLDEWFWSQPNAVDREKALPYLRSRGFDTTNLEPLEAVRKFLDGQGIYVADLGQKAKRMELRQIPSLITTYVSGKSVLEWDAKTLVDKNACSGIAYFDKARGYQLLDGISHYGLRWFGIKHPEPFRYILLTGD